LKSKNPPRIVTWLAVGVLITSIIFIIRLIMSYQIPDLPTKIPAWYLSLTGFFWGSSGLILSYGLFRKLSWALRVFYWESLIFVVWYWADRILFVRSEYGQASWPASLFITLIALSLIFWIVRRPDVRATFQEKSK
jgi:hypothetical protein